MDRLAADLRGDFHVVLSASAEGWRHGAVSFTPAYPIETARLYLRPVQPLDFEDLYAYHRDADALRYMYWEARTVDETREIMEKRQSQATWEKEGEALVMAAALKDTDRVIGETFLIWRSESNRQGELGFIFHPAYHGQGYAAEASRAVLALGFTDCDLHRIYGRCDPRNLASCKLLERLGMRLEGHFVQNERYKGEWADQRVYALLQEEWRRSYP